MKKTKNVSKYLLPDFKNDSAYIHSSRKTNVTVLKVYCATVWLGTDDRDGARGAYRIERDP